MSIIDPVKNAPEWFGMLAQNIINNSLSQKSTIPTDLEYETPHKLSYDGYQIWRLHIKDQSEVKAMDKYKTSADGAKLQWLQGPSLR